MTNEHQKHLNSKTKSLRHGFNFSKPKLAIFILVFALIGLLIYRSFAAGPIIAAAEAENMVLPIGASVVTDSAASGGKAVRMAGLNTTLKSQVYLPSSADQITINAKGAKCKGGWPQMTVILDGTVISGLNNLRVSSNSWNSYSSSIALTATTHSLTITNAATDSCRYLYADVFTFYGRAPLPTPAPAVSLSASPTSVTAGQSSTLTWSSTDATSCTASGGWSGAEPTSGTQSTGALNTSTTYSLACTGAGGTTVKSTTVNVTSTPSPTAADAKIAGVYWPNWSGTPALRDVPTVDNLIYSAFAYGDGSQGGGVIWKSDDGSGVSSSTFIADVQYDHSRGQKVILSIGGSNDVGIHLTNSTQVGQMVNSVNQIVSTYGFDGIDWDLENSANYNADSIVSVSNQLKQRWGQNFFIAMTPAPSDTIYKNAAKQLGDNLDFIAMQFYGYTATDAERISGIKSRINEMVNTYGVPASKLGIGASNYSGLNSSFVSSPSVYQQAYDQLEITYPDLRGVVVWEAILESTHGWPFTNLVGNDVRNLQ